MKEINIMDNKKEMTPTIDESVAKVNNHLTNLGFTPEAITYFQNRLFPILSDYVEKEKAYAVVANNIVQNVRGIFGDKQLNHFLREISVRYISDYDLSDELGIYEWEVKDILPPEEQKEYYKDKKEFVDKTRKERSTDLSRLERLFLYEMLDSAHYQDKDPLEENIIAARPRMISTPIGGQNKYRLKSRHP